MKLGRILARICLFLYATLSISHELSAIIVGSNSAVSRQAFVTFPAADNDDNEIRGFVYLDEGFALEDNTTSCTFNGLMPVRGEIALNGGNLFLKADVKCDNLLTFTSLGSIRADGQYVVDLSKSLAQIGAPSASEFVFQNIGLIFQSNVLLNAPLCFSGDCFIDGTGNVLELADTASFIVDTGSHLLLKDVRLEGIQSENVRCKDDSGSITLQDVDWVQKESCAFKNGSFLVDGHVSLIGTSTFSYESSQTSTIDTNSELCITGGFHFCLGRNLLTGNEPLNFVDETSILFLDNCTLNITESGVCFTKGSLDINRTVGLSMLATSTLNGLELGDGSAANDFAVRFSPAAVLDFSEGYLVYNNVSPEKFMASSATSRFTRHENAQTYIAQNLTLPKITIDVSTNLVQPVQVVPGKTLRFEKSTISLPDVDFEILGNQYTDFSYILTTSDYLFFKRGSLLLGVLALGAGNRLVGNGNLLGSLILTSVAAQIILGINGFVGTNIILNNGTLTLDQDLVLAPEGTITGPGTIDIGSSKFYIENTNYNWTTPTHWIGDAGQLIFDGFLCLSNTWTIEGSIQIIGNGNTLSLLDGAQIDVMPGSQLLLNNIIIDGLSGTNLRCVDDSGEIIWARVVSRLSDDYTFDHGSSIVRFSNIITGTYAFNYDSVMTSTLERDALLCIAAGMTFSIGANDGNQPLYFKHPTSTLQLNNSHLEVKNTGLHLTRGRLLASGDASFNVNSTHTGNGIIMGDGTDDGNFIFELEPASTLQNYGGVVAYNNTITEGITSRSESSRFLRGSASQTHAVKSITLKDITLETIPPALTSAEPGAIIRTENLTFVIPGTSILNLTCQVTSTPGLILLTGSDSIIIQNGTSPLFSVVSGVGNTISGEGTMNGAITLAGPTAHLIMQLEGSVRQNITLNGGNLQLGSSLILSNGIVLAGSGSVYLGSRNLEIGRSPTTWSGNIAWSATFGSISMHENITLNGAWTFTSDTTIEGNGYDIDLSGGGQLIVADNTQLKMRNVSVSGVSGSNIRCLGQNSSILWEDTFWDFDSNYTFTQGAFYFVNKNVMRGDIIFAYQTEQTSTIAANSQLRLDKGLTFSYDTTARDLLEFVDETASFILNTATLHATSTGLDLLNGTLLVRRNSILSSEVPSTIDPGDIDGISFGNGSGANDFSISVDSAVELLCAQGKINYRNVNELSLILSNNRSSLRMATGTTISLFQSINVNPGYIEFDDQSILATADGKTVIGPVVPTGVLFRLPIP